jgi:hypothetical protein
MVPFLEEGNAMNRAQQERLIELLGEDGALLLVSEFPNGKLPGKKFIKRILRSKLRSPLEGEAALEFLGKYGDFYKKHFGRRIARESVIRWPPWSRESIIKELGFSFKIR